MDHELKTSRFIVLCALLFFVGASAKGQEAVNAVREVGDTMVDAIDESLRKRPYTTLALAVGIGFLFGATWRR